MKTLVIFYSYTGKTKKLAVDAATQENADIIELKDRKERSKFNAYVSGSFAARGQKAADLLDFNSDFSAYDKIIIAMPIWAGYPAPPMNNVINALPAGKEVELIMNSASGRSAGSAEKTKKLITDKGCKVNKYLDVKS